jgi:eukaryotic-like serine/threonine-protein kinase
MTPEDFQRVEALYHAARERTAADRAALLAEADPDVRREVESLLAQTGGEFLDRPAIQQAPELLGNPTLAELTVGSSLGPYRIEGKLGEGGMGQVYRAVDTRLGRSVAIKAVQKPFIERFEREARAIASLSHPHICMLYDVGPDYLVLEYIDGRPLSGPLPPEQVFDLARQIASALQAAHARGIIHRDLKPANILVRDGWVKVVDFGLAKWADGKTTLLHTQEGMVLGTLAYMSPEQAEGRPADERSDIFSLGAIMYELLSGEQAFTGETMGEIIGAVLHRDPAPLQPVTPLTRIIERCLAKAPADRFQSAGDLTSALERPALATMASRRPSIAVLPFADLSPARDHEWFSDGLAEEIINALAQAPGLKVIARTSAFAFKGKPGDVRKIAATLGVKSVLEGSVRRSGDHLRVTAQLINATDGAHLWSGRYDRDVSDVFEIQDEIARAIVSALEVALLPSRVQRGRRAVNAAANDAYLKGRHHRFNFTRGSLQRSLEFLQEAVALDPDFALARCDIAWTYQTLAMSSVMSTDEAASRMRAEASLALGLEATLPEAHTAMALAAISEYDWPAAAARFERALAADRVSPDVRYHYGQWFLMALGRFAEAVQQAELALTEDPLNLFFRNAVGMYEICRGNEERGEAFLRQVLDLNDRMYVPNLWLCGLALRRGHPGEALARAERAYAIEPENPFVIGTLAGTLERNGERERADRVRQLLGAGTDTGTPAGLVNYHLISNDVDSAAMWFERAIAQRSMVAPWILPRMFGDQLISSSHWPALARAMSLPG